MNKEEIKAYYKEHPEDLFELCEEFNLHYNVDDRETLMKQYNTYKEVYESFAKQLKDDTVSEKLKKSIRERIYNLRQELETIELKYHIFDPKFNEKNEAFWLPEAYKSKAHEVFEYRKSIFNTQSIYEDMLLDNVICEDMGVIQNEKGGQDGMYDAFPFTFSKMGIVDEHDYKSSNGEEYHYRTAMIRSYGLSGCGGIAIVETITETTYGNGHKRIPKGTKGYDSRIQIVTLGEDDANHFLNSARLYCRFYDDKDHTEFLPLLDNTIKEYKKVQGTFKFE